MRDDVYRGLLLVAALCSGLLTGAAGGVVVIVWQLRHKLFYVPEPRTRTAQESRAPDCVTRQTQADSNAADATTKAPTGVVQN